MKDWHLEHMQKTIVKYVFGLTEDEKGSKWKVIQHKKYGGKIGYVRRNIIIRNRSLLQQSPRFLYHLFCFMVTSFM
jgi:hypothetical protein